jgi:hypothetical protein
MTKPQAQGGDRPVAIGSIFAGMSPSQKQEESDHNQ